MSIEPDDWINRFFGFGGLPSRRRGRSNYFSDMFREFDEMEREIERDFEESFRDVETKAPKDLIREYETPEGGKVREIGPMVYGYSMTIGPDGKPRVKEFGNVKSPMNWDRGFSRSPMISSRREPLSDVSMIDKEVRVVVEMPGIPKENIKINAYEDKVEVTTEGGKKYRQVINIPPEADIETVKSTYNNGILEIIFKKKEKRASKGKEIKVD